jgi:hypothetical protein
MEGQTGGFRIILPESVAEFEQRSSDDRKTFRLCLPSEIVPLLTDEYTLYQSMAQVPIYRRDFKSLADLRIEDARLLLRSGRQQGAYYLCGYAVECALKACIAKTVKLYRRW